jgi:hypothetical protein
MAKMPCCVAGTIGFVDLSGEEAHAGIELRCSVVVVVSRGRERCLFIPEEWRIVCAQVCDVVVRAGAKIG